jgi:LAGLIDADG-like domain
MPGKELELRPAAVIVPQGEPALPWQHQPLVSDAAPKRFARWAKRNNHFTVPLALLPGIWLAGLVLHHVHAAVYVALCGGVLAACVWFFAAHKWDRKAEQWYARLSAVLGAGWLALAAWLGPLSGMITSIALAAVLAAGCIAWGVPWWKHKRPRGMKKHQRFIAECDFWWQSHCEAWNLRGSRVIDAKLSGVTLWMRIQGIGGRHSFENFQQVLRLIESAAEGHSDIGLVRLGKVPGKPSQVDLFLKKQNPLRETVEYDMGTAPQSVHDLAPFGVSEAGEIAMRSLRRNRFTIGETRSGKALALDTPVPTPSGWTTMGDLKQGDVIFDEAGQPCRVTDAWDVRYDRPCYEVEFSDGTVIVADAEHQWLTQSRLDRSLESRRLLNRPRARKTDIRRPRRAPVRPCGPSVVTTEEMARTVRSTDGGHANHSIAVAGALYCEPADLPVPPYTLGAWLGDGTSVTGSVTSADPEIIAEIENEGQSVYVMPSTVKANHASYRVRGLTTRLGEAGVLGNKHIPVAYLRASEDQRRALLAGLLDTDGYCTRQGTVEFYSANERLAADVRHLVASLGYKPSLRSKTARLNGKDCGLVWTVTFATADKVFRLPRKVARLITSSAPGNSRRYVVAVRPIPSVPVRCVAVDSPNHLFLVGETCIPTHNSNDLLVGIAHLSGCPDGRYVLIDLKGGRSARPVLKSASAEYVITEIDEARMYTRMCVAEIKARSTNAYDGNEQLHATEDIPGIWTMVDETYGLTATENGAGDPECRRNVATMASQGAGLEFYEWIFTQNGSLETSVGTEQIRANLPWRTCYRVAEARHGQYVIPEYAKLDASKLEENGTCYDKYGKDVTPEQIRRPLMEHGLLTSIASQNAALLGARPPLRLYCGDQVAYQAVAGRDEDGNEIRRAVTWQEWWDARWTRLPEAFRKDSPQYLAAIAEHPVAAAEVIEQARYATRPVPSPEPGMGDARSAAARIAAESAAAPRLPDDFRPDPALVKRLGKVMATQEDRFCDTLEDATADSPVSPADLIKASGMGRSWVFGRLAALAEIGMVTQVSRGRYTAVPGSDIRRGLREIKARSERLAREAREIVNAA